MAALMKPTGATRPCLHQGDAAFEGPLANVLRHRVDQHGDPALAEGTRRRVPPHRRPSKLISTADIRSYPASLHRPTPLLGRTLLKSGGKCGTGSKAHLTVPFAICDSNRNLQLRCIQSNEKCVILLHGPPSPKLGARLRPIRSNPVITLLRGRATSNVRSYGLICSKGLA